VVSSGHFVAFAALTSIMVVVAGPSVLLTISPAVTVGRLDALLTVAGNAVGVYLQVVGVAFGLGALVSGSATVFTAVKLVGAGYLLYLGVQAIRHRRSLTAAFNSTVLAVPGRTIKVLRDGLVVGLANPKSVVFLAAILPQFVDRGRGAARRRSSSSASRCLSSRCSPTACGRWLRAALAPGSPARLGAWSSSAAPVGW
jgi:threonine/homoserine/homoserine lactone efflux protein